MNTSEGRTDRSVLPDLVYRIRPGENEELRYSLRSVSANADGLFRKVWVVVTSAAGLPGWLTNVDVVEAGSMFGRQADVRAKAVAAVNHPDVASRFLLMDDDHFLVDPIKRWAAFHMGPTSEYVQTLQGAPWNLTVTNSVWLSTIITTAQWMSGHGYGDVLVRQGHRPLSWSKQKLSAALAKYPSDERLDICSLYAMAGAAGKGRRASNSKITSEPEMFHQKMVARDSPWLSSNDRSFAGGLIGEHIRGMLPTPSLYER